MSHNPYAPPTAPVADVDTSPPANLNPWFSMWTKPRATIAQIVARDPTHLVVPLAALAGVGETLDRASARSAGDTLDLWAILSIAVIFGPVVGVIGLYVGSALLRWTGSWLGGQASSEHIRTAMAWSGVPVIWGMALWVPELALYGEELFTTATPRIDASAGLALVFFTLVAIEITIGVWAFVVFLKSLGQVQGFSAWKALGNGALALLVIVGPIVLLVVGVLTLDGPSTR